MGTAKGFGAGKFAARRSMAAGVACVLAWAAQTAGVFAGGPNVQVEGVARGNVTFQQNGATTIIRASDRSIINYNQFDIPAGSTVQFVQPGTSSLVLNRVNAAVPSQINGNLQSNGIVYLVNPAGVIFGNGARVDTAGIIAAGSHLSDADFINGVNHFTNGQGAVINRGTIQSSAVYLVGGSVENTGTIVAPNGLVAFAAGSDVYVVENNNSLMLKVSGPAVAAAGKAAVENSGAVQAPGGQVSMVAGDIYGLAVKNAGEVRAREITLQSKGETVADGELDASSKAPGTTGGTVQVLGDAVVARGTIDASGDAGGGTILLGGDQHGAGSVQTAKYTYVASTANISADALTTGDGGKVVVWSNNATWFYGNISARGGALAGGGGNAEVSGHNLAFGGFVNLTAPNGPAGTLLLDPAIVIESAGAAGTGADDTQLSDNQILSGDNGGAGTFNITNGEIVAQIAGADVIIGATASISINAAITASTTHNLLLSAPTIVLNAPITITGGGALTGVVPPNSNTNVSVNNGGLIQNAADLVQAAGTITIASSGTYAENVALAATINPTLITAGGTVSITGSLTANNSVTLGNGGTFALTTTGAQTYHVGVTLAAPTILTAPTINFASATTAPLTLSGFPLTVAGTASFVGIAGSGGALSVTGDATFNNNITVGSINVTATTTVNAASLTTTATPGGQTYGGAVTVNAATTTFANGAAGTIWFKSTVNPAGTPQDIVVTSGGVIQVDGTFGNATAFQNITLSATGNVLLNNNLNFTTQLSGNNVTTLVTVGNTLVPLDRAENLLPNSGGTLALTPGAGTYSVSGGTLNTSKNMILDTANGAVTIGAAIVDTGSLTFGTAAAGTVVLATTGTQTYSGAVVLNKDTALSSPGGKIWFKNTVDSNADAGGHSLAIDNSNGAGAGGDIEFGDGGAQNVGNGLPLKSLTTTSTGTTTPGNTIMNIVVGGGSPSVTTLLNQTYNNPVLLSLNTALKSTDSAAGGTIWLKSTVEASGAPVNFFVVTDANKGVITLDGKVGDIGPVQDMQFTANTLNLNATLNYGGTLQFGGGAVANVVVGAGGEPLRAGTIVKDGGTIAFASGTTHTSSLTPALDVLTLNGQDTNGVVIDTGGGSVTLRGIDASTNKSKVTFGSTGGVMLSTTGTQTYGDTVTLAQDTALVSTGAGTLGNVTFSAAIVDTVSRALSVTTPGAITFGGAVGTLANPLTSLAVAGAGKTTINAGVQTTGSQTYNNAVIAAGVGGTVLNSSTAGTIWFKSTVDSDPGQHRDLAVTSATGVIEIDHDLGTTDSLHGVSISAATLLLNAPITSSVAGQPTGANTNVTVNPTGTLQQGGALVAPSGTLTVAPGTYAGNVTIATGVTVVTTGPVTISGNLVATALTMGGAFSTTGTQSYGALTLSGNTSLTSTGAGALGNITFGSTIQSATPRSLIINTAGVITVAGAVGGGGNPLLSFATTGTGTANIADNITTTTTQTYAGPVSLTKGGAQTFSAAGGSKIWFQSTINDVAGSVLIVSTTGTAEFDQTAGVTPLNGTTLNVGDLSLNAPLFTLAISVPAINTVEAGGTAVLQQAVDFVASGGVVTVAASGTYPAGNVTINQPLTLHSTGGTVAITGNLSDPNALNLLTLGGAFTTTGTQTYNAPLTLDNTTTLVSSGGGAIAFNSTVQSPTTARALTVNSAGLTTFNAAVGGAGNPLLSLTSNLGATTIGAGVATVTTSGAQTYAAVTLGGNTNFAGTPVTFGGTVSAAGKNLTVTGNGAFTGPVTAAALVVTGNASFGNTVSAASVAVNGSSTLAGGTVTTTGGQTYTGPVTLGSSNTLTDTGNSNIAFGSTVQAAGPGLGLTVSTGGTVTFAGTAGGGANPLATITAAGTILLTGPITTSGDQMYAGPVSIGNYTSINCANIVFQGTLTGAALQINGNAEFDGAVALPTLYVGGNALIKAPTVTTTSQDIFWITISASQFYTGSLIIGASTTLSASSGPIVTGNISSAGGAWDLTITSTVPSRLLGYTIGSASNPFRTVTLGTPGDVQPWNFYSAVTTLEGQTYNVPLVIYNNGVLTSLNNRDIAIRSTVNSYVNASLGLQINTGGTVTFGGAVGNIVPLAYLNVSGASAVNGSVITTVGAQSYGGATTIAAGTTLTSGDAVAFGSSVNSAGALQITSTAGQTYAGAATFGGAATLNAATVAFSSSLTTASGLSVTTTGAQSYVGPVAIGGSASLNGASVAFSSSLGATSGLSVITSGAQSYAGPVAIGGGAVLSSGATVAFSSTLTTTPFLSGTGGLNVTSTGGQTYGGAVHSAGNVSLNAAAVSFNSSLQADAALSITTASALPPGFGAAVAYDQIYAGPVAVAGNTNLSSGRGVQFQSTLTTGGTLQITSPDAQNFGGAAEFGGATTLQGSRVYFGSALAAHGPLAVSTTTGQFYGGATAFGGATNLADNGGTGITFNSSIAGGSGDVSITTTGGNLVSGTSINIAQPITGDVLFVGPVDLGSLRVISDGNIVAMQSITAHDAAGITLHPNPALVPAIVKNGTLQSQGTIGEVIDFTTVEEKFYYAPAQLVLGGDLTALAGPVVLGGGRAHVPGVGTIFVDAASSTISGTDVTMGQNERLVAANPGTSSGSVTINAAATATLGDITALDTVRISAPTVIFELRPTDFVLAPTPQSSTGAKLLTTQTSGVGGDPQVGQDGVLSFVAGKQLQFATTTFQNSDGTPFTLNSTSVHFATSFGGGGSGVPGLVRAYDLKTTATSIALSTGSRAVIIDALRAGNPVALTLTYVPLLADGPSNTNPSSSIASALPTQLPSPVSDTELSVSDIEGLRDIGITPRKLETAEKQALLSREGVFDDVPDEIHAKPLDPDTSLGSLQIAVARLPVAQTRELLAAFRALFSEPAIDPKTGKPAVDATGAPIWALSLTKRRDIATKIEAGWKAFRDNKKDAPATGAEFRKYLEENAAKPGPEAPALEVLKQLQGLYARLDALFLAPSDLRKARSAVFRTVAAPGVPTTRGDPLNDQTVLESAVGVQTISVGMLIHK